VMARFQAAQPTGVAVAQLEILVRTAVFQSANELVGWMLQQAVDRIDAAYQPKPGEERKGRDIITAQGIFGHFPLNRDYYYHPGKQQGHYPADAALGLEVCYTPALAKLLCLEGADEATYLKAERHLEQTGGFAFRPVRFSGWFSALVRPRSNGRNGPHSPANASAAMRP